MSEIIYKWFTGLDERQKSQIEALGALYAEWNEKINVISRKDIDNLYAKHVLHSLALAKFFGPLMPGTEIIDIGTGGGFPGIPLAIYYPECTFHLIDRVGKKILVASEVAKSIGLENVTFQHGDMKECKRRANYVVSRAVMPLNDLLKIVRKNIKPAKLGPQGNIYDNGLVCLKGSDIVEESKGIKEAILNIPVCEYLNEPQFDEKAVIYIPIE